VYPGSLQAPPGRWCDISQHDGRLGEAELTQGQRFSPEHFPRDKQKSSSSALLGTGIVLAGSHQGFPCQEQEGHGSASSGKAGSGDTGRGGGHRPPPRLFFTAPSILYLHGHFVPQCKIATEIEKLGGAASPAQLLLHPPAPGAERGESARRQQAGGGGQAQAELGESLLPGSVPC